MEGAVGAGWDLRGTLEVGKGALEGQLSSGRVVGTLHWSEGRVGSWVGSRVGLDTGDWTVWGWVVW